MPDKGSRYGAKRWCRDAGEIGRERGFTAGKPLLITEVGAGSIYGYRRPKPVGETVKRMFTLFDFLKL